MSGPKPHPPRPGLLAAIGSTPLVRLLKLRPGSLLEIHAKLEFLNPGGSVKDRTALFLLEDALARGAIRPDVGVIESSSGNLGLALAQLCNYLEIRFICVVDPKTSAPILRMLELYGAELDRVTRPDPRTGEYLPRRIARVEELLSLNPGAFWPNQYANMNNALAHYHTMAEVARQVGRDPDYVFCAVSSCGTARGCARYIEEAGATTRLVAVDAPGSVINGGAPGRRHLPGLGASVPAPLFAGVRPAHYVQIPEREAVAGCIDLLRRESILAGPSSGAIVRALERLAPTIETGSSCVLILPDRGERYLDTAYSEFWVAAHLGPAGGGGLAC